MNGKYGKNEWKIKLIQTILILVVFVVVSGGGLVAYRIVKPRYTVYLEEKKKEEQLAKLQEEKRQAKEEEQAKVAEAQKAKVQSEEEEQAKTEKAEAQKAKAQAEKEEQAKAAKEKNVKKKKKKAASKYVIDGSDSRYLTYSDVENLSLKQINYAKNEIYARRGRKFQSRELQEFFDGKTWYEGTVEPGEFQESMLNDYERKNAYFLKDIEFAMDSRGYQLDQ